ncbi:MAG: ABC transporter permease subunit [Acidimicrobiales bacterium]|nr:ABC transporter permease subunit [Acidimicrobiales bacterium]MCB9393751.1 ABC transporter permease subunit [Acidimicrobiaceae bacterium]
MIPVVEPELGGPPTAPTGYVPAVAGRPRRRFGRLAPNLVLLASALFFTFPLLSLARFALQNVPTVLLGWDTLFDKWSISGITAVFDEPQFWESLRLSLKLALGTVFITLFLLLPTAIWVHLRVPKARAFVEFVTVLPYMVPAIALVAGIVVIKPHARWFLNSDLSLIPFYVVLALPFTYRSFDAGLKAIDLRTLVDASRSLGAGWGATVFRVLVPNMRSSIIYASFLTAAVVMGEYTLADTLLIESLPPFQQKFVGREPQAGYGLNLLALVATTLLFAMVTLLTRKRDPKRKTFAHMAAKTTLRTEKAA